MNPDEISQILSNHCSLVIAPAGHGKTEMISEFTKHVEGTQLILTHTNAGVEALIKRMRKNNIPSSKYRVFTIAGFCLLWCKSFPRTSAIDQNLDPLRKEDTKQYYAQLYKGAELIFQHLWALDVIRRSFSGLIVDEYQDCLVEQHKVFLALSKVLPVRAFGDPMQAIFGWAGELVDLYNLKFPQVKVITEPWRWSSTNPELGQWISEKRLILEKALLGSPQYIDFYDKQNFLKVICPKDFPRYPILNELEAYSDVAFITSYENKQLAFAKSMGGIFQHDEKQDSEVLFNFAESFSTLKGKGLCEKLMDFLQCCASHVGREFKSYINRIKSDNFNFERILKHVDFKNILLGLRDTGDYKYISQAIDYVLKHNEFNVYRKELFFELKRAISYSDEKKINLSESVAIIRRGVGVQKKNSTFKRLSTRTVLAKGLEFDCVIIDMSQNLDIRNFYVAISRAKRFIYILSDTRRVYFHK
jgi:DNA helicase-2/ATP-dependent DNA helicase PcrA